MIITMYMYIYIQETDTKLQLHKITQLYYTSMKSGHLAFNLIETAIDS